MREKYKTVNYKWITGQLKHDREDKYICLINRIRRHESIGQRRQSLVMTAACTHTE